MNAEDRVLQRDAFVQILSACHIKAFRRFRSKWRYAMESELFRETGPRPRDRCSNLLRCGSAEVVAAGE